MYEVGGLKDQRAVREIEQLLIKNSIQYEIRNYSGTYVLFVHNSEDISKAADYLRVSLGLPPVREIPEEWKKVASLRIGIITKILLGICIGVFLLMRVSPGIQAILMFPPSYINFWKILTPIFLHFGIIHLVFNMLWLKDLGKLIEFYKGKSFFISLIIFTAIFSNIMQYLMKGPMFGGMSGVIYGFVGYIWVNKAINNDSEMALPKYDVIMMIAWFFICAVGLIPHVANMAHGAGLAFGMLISVFESLFKRELDVNGAKKLVLFTLISIVFFVLTIFLELFHTRGIYYYNR